MTQGSRLGGLGLAAALLALVGCAPTYPKCKTDDTCKEHNEVCVQGSCQECGADTDCKTGFVCKETKCVPRPECASDGDCSPGLKCRDDKCQPACTASTDCPSGQSCVDGRCAVSLNDLTNGGNARGALSDRCALPVVYFGFNNDSLTREAQSTLDTTADCIRGGSFAGAITLAGHGDERGTSEYNLHLGERRANAVRKYLASLGIPSSKLKAISYGSERPAVEGHNEEAWAKNRRVELSN